MEEISCFSKSYESIPVHVGRTTTALPTKFMILAVHFDGINERISFSCIRSAWPASDSESGNDHINEIKIAHEQLNDGLLWRDPGHV